MCKKVKKHFFSEEVPEELYNPYVNKKPESNIDEQASEYYLAGINLFSQINIKSTVHEIDLLFRYLNHHLAWHCSSISEDLDKFARSFQHLSAKLFLLLLLNNFEHAACKIVFVIVSEQF